MANVGNYNRDIEIKLKQRTQSFALSVIAFVQQLPRGLVADVLARQIVRAATSVGANYRAACRGRSRADMISKLSIAEEETDESIYWLELIVGARLAIDADVAPLAREAEEILSILVKSLRTLRGNSKESNVVREEVAAYWAERDVDRIEALAILAEADPDFKTPNPKTPNSKPQTPNSKL